jgi:sulfhydrogenase subunit delta
MAKKVKLGFFSFTCCEGCMISFIEILNEKYFEWKDHIEIKYFRALKKVTPIGAMDIAFVEGAISTPGELKKIELIRKKAKKLVAVGSGAISGWPSNQRNKFSKEKEKKIAEAIKKFNQLKKIKPIKEMVKIDDEIPGCPVDQKLFIEKMEGYLNEGNS